MAEEVRFRCMRCGHEWERADEGDVERRCSRCRSNSVRKLKAKKGGSGV